jgi:hypothetical protein
VVNWIHGQIRARLLQPLDQGNNIRTRSRNLPSSGSLEQLAREEYNFKKLCYRAMKGRISQLFSKLEGIPARCTEAIEESNGERTEWREIQSL